MSSQAYGSAGEPRNIAETPDASNETLRDLQLDDPSHYCDADHRIQLAKMAELVANGKAPFRANLPSDETGWLRKTVAELRRRRLIRFIAQAIARDIHDGTHNTTRG
ncbi:MAG: hypothetical protein ACC628_17550 [Pirellulaceae bacterium]